MLATGPGAVVYLDGTTATRTGLLGCQRSTGDLRVLDTTPRPGEDDAETIGSVATAGQFVAAAHSVFDEHYGGMTQTVTVYDLRTGGPETGIGRIGVSCEGYSCEIAINDVVVNDHGDAAAHAVEVGGGFVESVVLTDPAGVQTTDTAVPTSLDSTVLSNLQLSDQQLTWTDHGVEKALPVR